MTKFCVSFLIGKSLHGDLDLRGLRENFGRAISEVKLRPAVNRN